MHKGLLFYVLLLWSALAVYGQSGEQSRTDPERKKSKQTLKDLINQGYLFAHSEWDTLSAQLKEYIGTSYHYTIHLIDSAENWSSFANNGIEQISKQLEELNNSGYPFAKIKLDTSIYADKKVELMFRIRQGPLINFDTISIDNSIPVKKSFLSKWLSVIPGDAFSEKKYRAISSKLALLPYLQLNGPPDISFGGGKASVYLPITYVNPNRVDGIIGVVNRPNRAGSVVNGFVKLDLNNLFSSGKELHIDWRSFNGASQNFSFSYLHRAIFRSTDIDIGTKILKQDSSFLNTSFNMGLFQNLQFGTRAYFGFDREKGIPLIESLENQFEANWYNIALERPIQRITNQNYISYELAIGLANKNFFIDGEATDEPMLRYGLNLNGQIMLHRGLAFNYLGTYDRIESDHLSQSQLYPVGGINSIRGFQENQFFAKEYWINQLEVRYFFEKSSYIHAFTDLGFIQDQLTSFWARSFGFGMALQSSNGLFRFIFANGGLYGNPLNFSNSKIHFGYQVQF
ncbi:MAG: hypothetical protein JXQ90_11170 [Cyclobacteriaceae bacterium]